MSYAQQHITRAVERLCEEVGLELPMTFALIGVDGAALLGSASAGPGGELEVTIRLADDPLGMPVEGLFVDAGGRHATARFYASEDEADEAAPPAAAMVN